MKAIYLQRTLALIFATLGGWCLLAPASVESLIFKPEFYIGNSTSELLVACFGAQAVLGSVVMWWSIFRPATFLAFGIIGSVPFFIFNYYFYFVQEMFTHWMLLDFLGNIGIFVCGVYGYRISKRELELNESK